jgi:putative ABC transport system permease protein
MLINYLKIALKVLLRRKFFTGISLFGIAFTLTMVLVVAGVVDHSLSAVAPEVHLDRMLFLTHLYSTSTQGNTSSSWMGKTGYGLLDRYARDLPDVEKLSIYSEANVVSTYLAQGEVESRLRYTDAVYWEILDFEFIEGGPFTVGDVQDGNPVVVITDAARRRLFGEQAALNASVEVDGQRLTVVGIVAEVDITRTSALADMWAPLSSRKSWASLRDDFRGDYMGMLLVRSRGDVPGIKAEFESRMLHVECPKNLDEFTISGTPRTRLEELAGWTGTRGDASVPSIAPVIWSFIGGLLLWMLLPTVNLVSINMSRIIERSSEIGVRKAFGASTGRLVGQFIVENIFLCIVGSGLALIGAVVVRELIMASGAVPYLDVRVNWRIFLYALASACLFGVLSGALPAWRMARLHPVAALRGGSR